MERKSVLKTRGRQAEYCQIRLGILCRWSECRSRQSSLPGGLLTAIGWPVCQSGSLRRIDQSVASGSRATVFELCIFGHFSAADACCRKGYRRDCCAETCPGDDIAPAHHWSRRRVVCRTDGYLTGYCVCVSSRWRRWPASTKRAKRKGRSSRPLEDDSWKSAGVYAVGAVHRHLVRKLSVRGEFTIAQLMNLLSRYSVTFAKWHNFKNIMITITCPINYFVYVLNCVLICILIICNHNFVNYLCSK